VNEFDPRAVSTAGEGEEAAFAIAQPALGVGRFIELPSGIGAERPGDVGRAPSPPRGGKQTDDRLV